MSNTTQVKSRLTMTIFTELLRVLDGSMGRQGRNIFLFVNSCAAHPQSMSILGNVKAAYFLFICMTLLQNLDLGIKSILGNYTGSTWYKNLHACWTQERMSQLKFKCSAGNIC